MTSTRLQDSIDVHAPVRSLHLNSVGGICVCYERELRVRILVAIFTIMVLSVAFMKEDQEASHYT